MYFSSKDKCLVTSPTVVRLFLYAAYFFITHRGTSVCGMIEMVVDPSWPIVAYYRFYKGMIPEKFT